MASRSSPSIDWVKDFEQLWSERFARMDVVLAELQQAETEEPQDGDDGDDD